MLPQTSGDELTTAEPHALKLSLPHARPARLTLGHNPRLALLCAYALLGPIATQLSYLLLDNFTDRDVSFLQYFQGAFLLAAAMLSLRTPPSRSRATKTARGLFAGVVLACSVFLLKKMAWDPPDRSALAFDAVWYLKIVAAPFWWWVAASVVRRGEDAERLLRYVLLGAMMGALFAVACYFTGAGVIAAYEYEGVIASVGASGVSSKQTVAYLAPAALVSAYRGSVQHRWSWTLGALLLVAATLLTYDRSVQVGLVIALVWLLAWRAFAGRGASSALSTRLIVLTIVAGIIFFWVVGFDTLSSRWSYDVEVKGMVGSGRSDFYWAAWLSYLDLKLPELLFGIGMSNVTEVMYQTCGRKVHTHSDFFDMLLGGGLLGMMVYFGLWRAALRNLRRVSPRSIHFAIMGGYVLIVATMSVITGVLAAPHAMFCLGAALHCLRVIAMSDGRAAPRPTHVAGAVARPGVNPPEVET